MASRAGAVATALAGLVLGVLALPAAGDESAKRLFAEHEHRILQVRVIDEEADKKAAIGSGFLVAERGLVATNYHVVAQKVARPDDFRLEFLTGDDRSGALTLVDFDVVNDLALLVVDRDDPLARADVLEIADAAPTKGDEIYSIGNPFDIGFTVVPGTYNGTDPKSYYEHIHFSGSINAGMSGGPALDADGRVIGINVATAGNQVSFLVPGEKLTALVADYARRGGAIGDTREHIRVQLEAHQQQMIDGMLAEPWPTQELGEVTTVGELSPWVKCWGSSGEDDDLYRFASNNCASGHAIFLRNTFSTGVVAYQSFWLEAHELGPRRFMSYYGSIFQSFHPDNRAGEDDVGAFACDDWLVRDAGDRSSKAVLCLRAYQEYTGLYDALYLQGSIDSDERAFVSHFTLAGVSRESLRRFLVRFSEVAGR